MKASYCKIAVLLANVLLPAEQAYAQRPVVAGAGYTIPMPIDAAPGQVITLFASGVGANITKKVIATLVPLPTTLAGITVTLFQTSFSTTLAPILAVYPASACIDRLPLSCGAPLLAVTIQMPFELVVVNPLSFANDNHAQIRLSDGVNTTDPFQIYPKYNQVHILRQGDMLLDNTGDARPAVQHQDGSLVTALNPAQAGEEVVAYALGLGATIPAVPTGRAAPLATSVPQSRFSLNYDYLPNAAPRPGVGTSGAQTAPVFVGIVLGTVGVYQFNFVVPPLPAKIDACGIGTASNLTVTLYSSPLDLPGNLNSFDGAQICVAPPVTTP